MNVPDFSEKAHQENKRDWERLKRASLRTPPPRTSDVSKKGKNNLDRDRENYPYSVRASKCKACIERWKIPMPEPKANVLKKNVIPTFDEDNDSYIRSCSAHRYVVPTFNTGDRYINMYLKQKWGADSKRMRLRMPMISFVPKTCVCKVHISFLFFLKLYSKSF